MKITGNSHDLLFKNFTIKDINNLKTFWGQQYLALAQSYGPSTWGIS